MRSPLIARLMTSCWICLVLDTVTRRARKVLKDHDTLVLSNQAFDRFLTALDEPAQAVPELVELFEQHPPFSE